MTSQLPEKLFKEFLQLTGKKARHKKKLFFVESFRCIKHFLQKDNFEENECLIKIPGNKKSREFLKNFSQLPPIYELEEKLFSHLTNQSISEGLLGISKMEIGNWEYIDFAVPQTFLLIDGLSDPENMGVILRTAALRKVKHIFVQKKNTVDPFHPRSVRCSLGGIFYVKIHFIEDSHLILKKLQENNTIAIEPTPEANQSLEDFSFSKDKNYLICIGNEIKGLRGKISPKACNYTLKIKQSSSIDSLNTAIATSIFIYEATKHYFNLR